MKRHGLIGDWWVICVQGDDMLAKKLSLVVLIGAVLCSGLFAADPSSLSNTHFDGDALNTSIRRYITNVSNLIPDSTSLQNVWSFIPEEDSFWFGGGLNGSFTFYDQKDVGKMTKNANAFTSSRDLSTFPESVPYLPGIAIDFRSGFGRFDFGVVGMWIDDEYITESFGEFLGKGNHFSYRMLGADFRYTLLKDGQSVFGIGAGIWPAISLQAGYYFTWITFGVGAGRLSAGLNEEKVNVQFRNDSVFFTVQASKDFFLVTPYLGMRLILSKTDTEFDWETHRPVVVKGVGYNDGAHYYSGMKEGDFYTYFQFYGGVGFSFLFPHIVTIGGAYNVVTNHFGINMAMRAIF